MPQVSLEIATLIGLPAGAVATALLYLVGSLISRNRRSSRYGRR